MSKQTELKNRLRIIAAELEQGISTGEIIEKYTSPQYWNAGKRTVERYIALARDIVMENINEEDALIESMRGFTMVAEKIIALP